MNPNQEDVWRPELADDAPVLCRMGPGFLRRLIAHVLIRVLILGTLPPHVQARAWLFPVWPLAFWSGPMSGDGVERAETGANGGLFDKANIQHHFEVSGFDPQHPTYRLAYLEEPHGDRQTYFHSAGDRLDKIVEELNGPGGRTPVRELRLTYKSVLGTDRIETAEIVALSGGSVALKVTYTYDEHGNLKTATRSGQNVGGASLDDVVWSYQYDTTDEADRHQLLEARDPNGSVTQYQYYRQSDPFPGDATTAIERKAEYVKAVRHFDPREVKYAFVYDQTEALQNRFKRTVKDPLGYDRLYTLDSKGQELQRDEPLGKTTKTTWKDDDVVKETEQDAEGRLTRYGYDGNGNRTLERIETADLGPVERIWGWDGTFNKPTLKQDAEGHATTWVVVAPKGDATSMTDAQGNETAYEYQDGMLTRETDARQNATEYGEHNAYGQWQRKTDALGNVTMRDYDARGRLLHESDSFGRDLVQEWDALDRVVKVTRRAGGQSADEVTLRRYYPSGELAWERTGNGAETTLTLDGMNRLKETVTRFGALVVRGKKTYDLNGNVETETDAGGVTRRHTYDALNRLVQTAIESGPALAPVGPVASYEYNLVGAKKAETDLLRNQRTDYVLDGLYRAKEQQLPESYQGQRLTVAHTFDKVGNVLTEKDKDGKITESEYDQLNRLVRVTRDLGGVAATTRVRYCNDHQDPAPTAGIEKCEQHDELGGRRTLYEYDALHRVKKVTERLEGPDGDPAIDEYVTETTYQDAEHQMTVKDPRQGLTVVRLDGLNHVAETRVDDGGLSLVTTTVYDGLGLKKRVSDSRGNTTFYLNDGLGRVTRVTDRDHRTARYFYDAAGLKTKEIDRRGIVKVYEYQDNLRRLTREGLESAPLSGVQWNHGIQYLDAQKKRVETDARGKTTTFELDGLGREIKIIDHDSKVIERVFDGENLREQKDKNGRVTRFEYDGLRRLKKTIDPPPFDGQTVEVTYLDSQNQEIAEDARGIRRMTQRDSLGRVRSVTRALGEAEEAILERNVYDGNSNKAETQDADGDRVCFGYDLANRVISKTQGCGSPGASLTTYKLDENGNVLEEQDQRARDTGRPYSLRRLYDRMDRVTDEWSAAGDHTHFGYDGEGNRTLVVAPEGQPTVSAYEELGRLRSVTQPGNRTSAYVYDEARNLVRETDADGRETAFAYDNLNRRKETKRDPGGLALTTAVTLFDANGNPREISEANGETTTLTYDELNRVKTRSYAAPAVGWTAPFRHTLDETDTYDENDNLVRREEHDVVSSGTDPPLRVTMRVFDKLDRLKSETTTDAAGATRTVVYEYYPSGLKQSVTDSLTGLTSYTYDTQKRLRTVTTPAGTAIHEYYGDGLLKSLTKPDGSKVTYLYDDADRLVNETTTKGAQVLTAYAYGYDRNGNRLKQWETNGGAIELTSYGYDELDRLETIVYPPDATHTNGRKVEYGYDNGPNRTSEVESDPVTAEVFESKTGVFDRANRLTELTDNLQPAQTTTIGWDGNGNQASKTQAGLTTNYRYDLRDQLAEVERGGQTLTRFLNDAFGRRILKVGDPTFPGDTGLRHYLNDGQSLLSELDQNGNVTARYEWGGDRLVSLLRPQAGTREYFQFDGFSSVTALTDDTGTVTSRYHLTIWGELRDAAELSASANRFLLTGHLYDTETKLYYAHARYLDPELGRFIQQDPNPPKLGEPPSLNAFAYAYGNPGRYVDLDGRETLVEAAAREQQRRLASAHGPSFTENQGKQIVPADGPVVVEYRGPTTVQVNDEATTARAAEITDIWNRDPVNEGKTLVMKDDPGAQGEINTEERSLSAGLDPNLSATIRHQQQVAKDIPDAVRTFGVVGVKVSEAALTVLWNPLSNTLTLATGKDINEQEASKFWAGVQIGTSVFVAVAGTVVKVYKQSKNFAEDVRVAQRLEHRIETGEKELLAAERVLPSTGAVAERAMLPAARTAEQWRNTPGRAFGTDLPTIAEGQHWLRGSGADAGRFPGQIAERLNGRRFETFKDFREAAWREVAADPVLSKQFGPNSLREMQAGRAPFAPGSGRVGGRIKYEIDHVVEIQDGGGVYDLNNLIIRTPVNHLGKTP